MQNDEKTSGGCSGGALWGSYVQFSQKECEFFMKYVYNDQRICYNNNAEGESSLRNSQERQLPRGRIAGASGKVFATRGSYFAIVGKDESFYFRKTAHRTRESS